MQKSKYVIGITGHRRLSPSSLSALTTEVGIFYQEKAAEYGAANITVLSSIAEGADTICAKLALDKGFRLVVPLPMYATEYRRDFMGTAAAEFDCLLSLSNEAFVVSMEEALPTHPQRGYYYRQAGIYVTKNCDVLLAVWDGVEKDTPDGAGTWETIKLAREFGKAVRLVEVKPTI